MEGKWFLRMGLPIRTQIGSVGLFLAAFAIVGATMQETMRPMPLSSDAHRKIYTYIVHIICSGGRLCTLIGVPCRLSMLSTFSTFANVLFQYKSPRAEGAKTDPPPGYTYEGTQTTA